MSYTDKYSGVKYSQREIDINLRIAKQELIDIQKEEHGWNFCVKCAEEAEDGGIIENDMAHSLLDCSHNKPVKKCKEDSEIEKIWDVNNMTILCRYHHAEYDKLSIQSSKI